jgi:hypothetical protein
MVPAPKDERGMNMSEFVYYSRKLKKVLTFSIPGKSYVYIDINGKPGCTGMQICDGGRLMGNTISATPETLPATARKWVRQYLRNKFEG